MLPAFAPSTATDPINTTVFPKTRTLDSVSDDFSIPSSLPPSAGTTSVFDSTPARKRLPRSRPRSEAAKLSCLRWLLQPTNRAPRDLILRPRRCRTRPRRHQQTHDQHRTREHHRPGSHKSSFGNFHTWTHRHRTKRPSSRYSRCIPRVGPPGSRGCTKSQAAGREPCHSQPDCDAYTPATKDVGCARCPSTTWSFRPVLSPLVRPSRSSWAPLA
jgi:hypothetical protein